ncbi:Regulator of free ubiquitin chains 1 [Nakaseomyces bracarensis]|uniref:Regulator of free ubiquitin chains 1 n=1 Tax=Nakaseomyces bracarensis TaxID=273131 RepID=A0ABR4NLJ5_9SACH
MKSSQQLGAEARDFQFNPNIPLKLYLKTCVTLLNNASDSFQGGDKSLAYFYYFRYVDLCTNKLPTHPQVRIMSNDSEVNLYLQEYKQLLRLEVPHILKIMEGIKREIDALYERHRVSLANNIASPLHPNPAKVSRMDALLNDYYVKKSEGSSEPLRSNQSRVPESTFNEKMILMKENLMCDKQIPSQKPTKVSAAFYPDLPTLF